MLFFDRPTGGERAVIVHIKFSEENFHEDLEEFRQLAVSAGVTVISEVIGRRDIPDPKYFIGKGKLEEVSEALAAFSGEVVLFNHALQPSQEKHLERYLKCRVVDRVTLILDIFAQRAQTHEGKLQVELAQLQHLSARLVRGWTHLERQRGGVGLRGPGETQLESDRRAVRVRIDTIKERLEKVRAQRAQNRQARKKSRTPVVALVGYTNAGKSTLFNALTGKDSAYVENRLFATLDPILRRIESIDAGVFILADTVGFIRHLPHELVNAFRATLEEVAEADLLLHVIDAYSPEHDDNMVQVYEVLEKINAEAVPVLEVMNKVDLLDVMPRIDYNESGTPMRVWVSARAGLGLNLIERAIGQGLTLSRMIRFLRLKPTDAKFRAQLYERKWVLEDCCDDQGTFFLKVQTTDPEWQSLLLMNGLLEDDVLDASFCVDSADAQATIDMQEK